MNSKPTYMKDCSLATHFNEQKVDKINNFDCKTSHESIAYGSQNLGELNVMTTLFY